MMRSLSAFENFLFFGTRNGMDDRSREDKPSPVEICVVYYIIV